MLNFKKVSEKGFPFGGRTTCLQALNGSFPGSRQLWYQVSGNQFLSSHNDISSNLNLHFSNESLGSHSICLQILVELCSELLPAFHLLFLSCCVSRIP